MLLTPVNIVSFTRNWSHSVTEWVILSKPASYVLPHLFVVIVSTSHPTSDSSEAIVMPLKPSAKLPRPRMPSTRIPSHPTPTLPPWIHSTKKTSDSAPACFRWGGNGSIAPLSYYPFLPVLFGIHSIAHSSFELSLCNWSSGHYFFRNQSTL